MARPGRVLIGAIGLAVLLPFHASPDSTPSEGPSELVASLGRLNEDIEPAELWTIFGRCEAELREGSPSATPALLALRALCPPYAEKLAETAMGSERESLLARLQEDGEEWLQAALVKGLLTARVADRLADLPQAVSGAAPSSRTPLELPKALADAVPELQDAWRLHQALDAAYLDLVRAADRDEKNGLSFFEHRSEFDAAIVGLLRGEVSAAQAIAVLTRFRWGGGCGFGSQVLNDPRNLALLLALLGTGDRHAAAGALLRVRVAGAPPPARLKEGWDREALGRLGFDWEAVALGQVLLGWGDTAKDVARHGSARAARLLWQAHSLSTGDEGPPLEEDEAYLHALAALVAPTNRCSAYATSSSNDVVRSPDAPLVEADVEAEVLGLLARKVGHDASLSEAETAAHLLLKACRPESLPAFRRMARSPYARVREPGALALRALGERPPPARSNPPVVVQVAVNASPLHGRVNYELSRSSHEVYAGSASSTAEARSGVLHLDRDPFLDRKAVVKTVTVGSESMTRPDDLWFSATLPRPRDLDATLRVDVETQALTLVCPQAETMPLTITLEAEQETWGERTFTPILYGVTLGPGPASVAFPRLQRGRYRWMVVGPEGEVWQSDELSLGRKPLTSTCGPLQSFEPGILIAEDGESPDR